MAWNRYPYRSDLKELARSLRKNMTYAEVLLWQEIRKSKLGARFHRQTPILDYIVDFLCRELAIVIEVDGSRHEDPEVYKNDIVRQRRLEKLGLTVLRFTNKEVFNHRDKVMSQIAGIIEDKRSE